MYSTVFEFILQLITSNSFQDENGASVTGCVIAFPSYPCEICVEDEKSTDFIFSLFPMEAKDSEQTWTR